MSILLIIIGAILFFICGILCLVLCTATNQANWEDFYKRIEEQNLGIQEEEVHSLVCKMIFWSTVGILLGFASATGGMILLAL